jgi:sigma-E factor negative regulatory protein RseB
MQIGRPASIAAQIFFGVLLALNLTTGLAATAEKEREAARWLERMMTAVRALNYQGTFIYLHDNQLESIRVVHAVEDGQIREHLISLNGAPREVIRDKRSITCVRPESQQISIDKRPPSNKFLDLLPQDLGKLTPHYAFRTLGTARIAGHQSKVVAIIPRDDYRYGYRFCLDQESALPLKSDLMDEQGQALEQTMFTNLEIGVAEWNIDESNKQSGITIRKSDLPRSEIESGRPQWHFESLPAGFVVTSRSRVPDTANGGVIDHYVLSDGLASLSIFIEAAGEREALEGASRLGAINAWGGRRADHQITAVGEVPAITLLSVVEAMRYNAAESP